MASSRIVARVLTCERDVRQAEALRIRVPVEVAYPNLVAARTIFDRFKAKMASAGKSGDLDLWLADAAGTEMVSFANGILADRAAVPAAITKPRSDGQTEGQVTRLKLVKRQMYGRAKVDLLRARLVPAVKTTADLHQNCAKAKVARLFTRCRCGTLRPASADAEGRVMERQDVLELMGELKLAGMRHAYDEVIADGIKCQRPHPYVVSALLKAEIAEKHARSIKYQMTIARLPLAKDLDGFEFAGTPINEALERDLATGAFLRS